MVKVYVKPRSRVLFNGSLEKHENSESEKGLRSLLAKCSWNTVSERESRFRKWSRSFEPASWIKCCQDKIRYQVRGKRVSQTYLFCCYYFLYLHRVSLKSLLWVNEVYFHRIVNKLHQITIKKLFWLLLLKRFKIIKLHKKLKLFINYFDHHVVRKTHYYSNKNKNSSFYVECLDLYVKAEVRITSWTAFCDTSLYTLINDWRSFVRYVVIFRKSEHYNKNIHNKSKY